jgi:hypothetical protein
VNEEVFADIRAAILAVARAEDQMAAIAMRLTPVDRWHRLHWVEYPPLWKTPPNTLLTRFMACSIAEDLGDGL